MIRNLYNLLLRLKAIFSNYVFENKIHNTATVVNPFLCRKSVIGRYCYVARNSSLYRTHLSGFVSIGPNVVVGGLEHLRSSGVSTSSYLSKIYPPELTRIGPDVWIGSNVVIRSGVTIAQGSVIGAGSVVLSDTAPYSISVGVPAKAFRYRFSKSEIEKLLVFNDWDLPIDRINNQLNKQISDLSDCGL